MKARLILTDGRYFEGLSLGAMGTGIGEVVFNTAMMGYQEILTDPSYQFQLVTMTYPQIGNYGVNPSDFESRRIYAAGFIIREYSPVVSHWQASKSLDEYLKYYSVVGISDIDTRQLTRRQTAGCHDPMARLQNRIPCVDHLLLGGVLAGQAPDVLHDQKGRAAVAAAEFLDRLGLDRVGQRPGEIDGRGVDDRPVSRPGFAGLGQPPGQVGLAEARVAVDEQRIVGMSWILGDRQASCMGQPIVGPNHKGVKGVATIEIRRWPAVGLGRLADLRRSLILQYSLGHQDQALFPLRSASAEHHVHLGAGVPPQCPFNDAQQAIL